VARYRRGVFASILLALRPAARPTGWAVLAALGAGILTQSILVAMAVTFGLIHPSDLFASLVAASAPVAALVAGFVARVSGGWRAAALLFFFGLVVGAAATAILAAFPFCVPSAICGPANPIGVFAALAGADGITLLGALLSIVVRRGAPARWAILEGTGAHEFVANAGRLLALVPNIAIGSALGLGIAAGIAVVASSLILVRRSERPIRDAGVVAIVIIGTQVLPVLVTLRGLAGLTSLAAAAATSAADALLDAAAIPLVTALVVLALRRRRSRMESSPAEEKRG